MPLKCHEYTVKGNIHILFGTLLRHIPTISRGMTCGKKHLSTPLLHINGLLNHAVMMSMCMVHDFLALRGWRGKAGRSDESKEEVTHFRSGKCFGR